MQALYWFTRDLRVHDNPTLLGAARGDSLLCVFIVDPCWFEAGWLQGRGMGAHRWNFLCFVARPMTRLRHSLKEAGLRLRRMNPITSFSARPKPSSMASNGVRSSQAISMIRDLSPSLNRFVVFVLLVINCNLTFV